MDDKERREFAEYLLNEATIANWFGEWKKAEHFLHRAINVAIPRGKTNGK